jgi:hypothetical protein
MSEGKRSEGYSKSPILFATLWFGIPLVLVVVSVLVMNRFGL